MWMNKAMLLRAVDTLITSKVDPVIESDHFIHVISRRLIKALPFTVLFTELVTQHA